MNEMFNLPEGTEVLDPLTLNGIRFAGDHTVLTPGMLDEMAPRKKTPAASGGTSEPESSSSASRPVQEK